MTLYVPEGVWGLRWSENHQKHAQSTYLDEYLWLENLTEKFLLENFLQHFEFQKIWKKTHQIQVKPEHGR